MREGRYDFPTDRDFVLTPSSVCCWVSQPNQPTPRRTLTCAPAGKRKRPCAAAFHSVSRVRQLPDCTYLLRPTHELPKASALFVTLRLFVFTGSSRPGTAKIETSVPSTPEKTKTCPWGGSTTAKSATPSLLRSPTTTSPATRPISGKRAPKLALSLRATLFGVVNLVPSAPEKTESVPSVDSLTTRSVTPSPLLSSIPANHCPKGVNGCGFALFTVASTVSPAPESTTICPWAGSPTAISATP